jgi:hypothetical protein
VTLAFSLHVCSLAANSSDVRSTTVAVLMIDPSLSTMSHSTRCVSESKEGTGSTESKVNGLGHPFCQEGVSESPLITATYSSKVWAFSTRVIKDAP